VKSLSTVPVPHTVQVEPTTMAEFAKFATNLALIALEQQIHNALHAKVDITTITIPQQTLLCASRQ